MRPLRRPAHLAGPFRHRPSMGLPITLLEQAAQYVWRHKLLLYIALVATVSLVVQAVGAGLGWHQ